MFMQHSYVLCSQIPSARTASYLAKGSISTHAPCSACMQVDWQGSWLLDGSGSKRIVVHMRRGDVTSLTTKRALPTSFYLNVVKQVIQVGRQCCG